MNGNTVLGEIKTGILEYVGRQTRRTGRRVGYFEVRRWGSDACYSEDDIHAALRSLNGGGLRVHREQMPINPAHSGPKFEETYELAGSSATPKYHWPEKSQTSETTWRPHSG